MTTTLLSVAALTSGIRMVFPQAGQGSVRPAIRSGMTMCLPHAPHVTATRLRETTSRAWAT